MEAPLSGCLILIAEDEPLIAFDITQAFEDEGATVISACTLKQALRAADDPALSAAILDHALSDGDSSKVYERMKERNIPFITYSGYDRPKGHEGEFVQKPESVLVLVVTVKRLIAERRKPNLGTTASLHDLATHLNRGLAGLAKLSQGTAGRTFCLPGVGC